MLLNVGSVGVHDVDLGAAFLALGAVQRGLALLATRNMNHVLASLIK
jgi:hypothetical protein